MTRKNKYEGAFTALVTPFTKDTYGDLLLDIEKFKALVDWQIKEGVDGLVVCGTTGEAPSLSYKERETLITACIESNHKQLPIMVGAGSNNFDATIKYCQQAQALGADSILLVTPYYVKPTQRALVEYYSAICEYINLPIMLYNVPGRTSVNMSDETIAELAKLPNIFGIKDATGDLSRPLSLQLELEKAGITKDFVMFSGDDVTALGFNAMGGTGAISVVANVAPKLYAKMQKLTNQGDFKEAYKIHFQLGELAINLFCETNPVPAKYALSQMGIISEYVRLPLTTLSEESKAKVKRAIGRAGSIVV
jgi:4-hydroxy-tetrahydrodipicolinate synthase